MIYSRGQLPRYKCTVSIRSLYPAAWHSLSLHLFCVCLCLCRSWWIVLWREECCTRQWLWWRIAGPSSGTWSSPWTGTLSMSWLTIRWGNALLLLLLSGEMLSVRVMLRVARPSFSCKPTSSSPFWQQAFAVLTRPWARCCMCRMKFKSLLELNVIFILWKLLFTCVFMYNTR